MHDVIRIAAIGLVLLLGAGLCAAAVLESSTYRHCAAAAAASAAGDDLGSQAEPGAAIALGCVGAVLDANSAAITALSTLIVAAFAAILAVFSASLARSARLAAEAADLSARTAIAVELPVIRAEAGKLAYGYNQDEAGRRHNVSVDRLTLANLGKTKAFPIEAQVGCAIGRRLPRAPVYRFRKPFPVNAILEPEQRHLEIGLAEFEFEAPPDIYNLLRGRSTELWFYCNLVYLDFMQGRHEAGFCWKRHDAAGMGELLDDPTPAYNRKT